MAKTLLQGTNEVLKAVGITSSSGELTSLTDSGRQAHIDQIVQLWNILVDEVFNLTGLPVTGQTASGTVTLVTGTREYSLPSTLVKLHWPLINQTLGHVIQRYPDGYQGMRKDQRIPGNYTGRPVHAAINPNTGLLRMATSPNSEENGEIYEFTYDKDNSLSAATDTFTFNDTVFRSMVEAVAQNYRKRRENKFDEREFRKDVSRATAYMLERKRRTH